MENDGDRRELLGDIEKYLGTGFLGCNSHWQEIHCPSGIRRLASLAGCLMGIIWIYHPAVLHPRRPRGRPRIHPIKVKTGPRKGLRNVERALEWQRRYLAGETLEEIGRSAGCTRERVRQVLAKLGVNPRQGGRSKKAIDKRLAAAERLQKARDARCALQYGCTWAEAFEINGAKPATSGNSRAPCAAFFQQKRSAQNRGIGWEITLPEWWAIWQESGRWKERGRGKGYVMARHGDEGPYRVGNVYICTSGQNFSDSYQKTPWSKRFPHMARGEDGLTPAEREALQMREAGMSYAEMAAKTGKRIDNLRGHVYAARKNRVSA